MSAMLEVSRFFSSLKRKICVCSINSSTPPMCLHANQFMFPESFHKLWYLQYGNISLWLIYAISRKSVTDYMVINISRRSFSKKVNVKIDKSLSEYNRYVDDFLLHSVYAFMLLKIKIWIFGRYPPKIFHIIYDNLSDISS